VDGVKSSAEKVKAMDAKTIDRMEVLNDKSAVEKYGDEAKGGVIIITTKK
jgi:outer membrane receptor for ferrienterochelin and colicin